MTLTSTPRWRSCKQPLLGGNTHKRHISLTLAAQPSDDGWAVENQDEREEEEYKFVTHILLGVFSLAHSDIFLSSHSLDNFLRSVGVEPTPCIYYSEMILHSPIISILSTISVLLDNFQHPSQHFKNELSVYFAYKEMKLQTQARASLVLPLRERRILHAVFSPLKVNVTLTLQQALLSSHEHEPPSRGAFRDPSRSPSGPSPCSSPCSRRSSSRAA